MKYLCEQQNVNKEAVDEDGRTPFFVACQNDQLAIVKYLCENQNINKEAENMAGTTPLQAAWGFREVKDYLLSIGVAR